MMNTLSFTRPVCRGSWRLGTACGKCDRCIATMPDKVLNAPSSIEMVEAAMAQQVADPDRPFNLRVVILCAIAAWVLFLGLGWLAAAVVDHMVAAACSGIWFY